MIVVTMDAIPGKRVVEVLELVYGDGSYGETSRGANNFESFTGQMASKAERMGANAIIGAGYAIGGWYAGMHFIAYGTAVVVEDAD